jgi:formylglycine-generating enzyme required for sulfatase activity
MKKSLVLRGGSWGSILVWVRSAFRGKYNIGDAATVIGFRLARRNTGNKSCVLRGGSWIEDAEYCRPASRDWNVHGNRHVGLGFRLAKRNTL